MDGLGYIGYVHLKTAEAYPRPPIPTPSADIAAIFDCSAIEKRHAAAAAASANPSSPPHPSAIMSSSATINTTSSAQQRANDLAQHPLTHRHGRRYLRDPDQVYPLPCDLPEIQRQILRSLVTIHAFGSPCCAPQLEDKPPTRVLDVCCGAATWDRACHDYFAAEGITNIEFTGIDIVAVAPDLKKQGVNWTFVHGDLRQLKLPFGDDEFDYIYVKDAHTIATALEFQCDPLDELIRVLKKGGVLEMWESDFEFRTLLPHPPAAPGISPEAQEHADATATYTISAATPFAPAQNKWLADYNKWICAALEKRKLTPSPCAFISQSFYYNDDVLKEMGNRRIAIPLSDIRWEREAIGTQAADARAANHRLSYSRSDASSEMSGDRKPLTQDQAALRKTALTTCIQLIESMEPLLMEASGKGRDEWDRWWAGMMTDLLQNKGASAGECLQIGAWWAVKR